MLSVLSVVIHRFMLHVLATRDVDMRLAHCALTRLCQKQSVCKPVSVWSELELRWTSFLRCNFPCNRFVSVQTGLKRERQQTK